MILRGARGCAGEVGLGEQTADSATSAEAAAVGVQHGRKLLVALWKYVTAGVVIEGAVMKPA